MGKAAEEGLAGLMGGSPRADTVEGGVRGVMLRG